MPNISPEVEHLRALAQKKPLYTDPPAVVSRKREKEGDLRSKGNAMR